VENGQKVHMIRAIELPGLAEKAFAAWNASKAVNASDLQQSGRIRKKKPEELLVATRLGTLILQNSYS
jgi:hypothetical protein